ncbi:F-box/LRR-repeat protein 14-like [Branchiostoma lanceolatum]|uniref:F-box/LRR-repeat protein 14-like n=1 Tax=Branchiostoma lanceolatum TaxID=7740 RepID=UPI00345609EB
MMHSKIDSNHIEVLEKKSSKKKLKKDKSNSRCSSPINGQLHEEPLSPNWSVLPPDIFFIIFSYLTPSDRASIRVVCKTFQRMIDHPSVWRHKVVYLCYISKYEQTGMWTLLQSRKIERVMVQRMSDNDCKKLRENLPQLKGLQILQFQKYKQLRLLKDLTELRQLRLGDCTKFTDKELVTGVTIFQHLTVLELSNINMLRDNAFKQLVRLKNLEELTVRRCLRASSMFAISGMGLQYVLFRLPKLRCLTLYAVGLSSDELSLSFTPPKGRVEPPRHRPGYYPRYSGSKKNAPFPDIPEEEAPSIQKLQLQSLTLTHSLSWPMTEEALSQLDTVETLCLNSCYLFRRRDLPVEDVTSIFRKLINVKSLDLASTNCKNTCLEHMPGGLESLDLRDCYSVSGIGLQSLSDRAGPNMKHLGLALCNRVSNHPLSMLHTMFPNLETLDLSSCRCVTQDTLAKLLKLEKLRWLGLRGCTQLTLEAVQKMQEMSGNRIRVEGPSLR